MKTIMGNVVRPSRMKPGDKVIPPRLFQKGAISYLTSSV